MAARVTCVDVKKIFKTSETDLDAYISIANTLTDKVADKGELSLATLKEIERWLAAHYAAVALQQAESIGIGPTKVSYAGKTGTGLEFTRYGQQALLLDTTKVLANLKKEIKVAGVTYLGGVVEDGEVVLPPAPETEYVYGEVSIDGGNWDPNGG